MKVSGETLEGWLRVVGRTGNILFGGLFAVAGLRVWFYGPGGLCSFDEMSAPTADVVGGGLVVGALLLLIPRTAVIGLVAMAAWILLWTWVLPSSILSGSQPCSPSAFVLAGLFLNMGVMGLSRRETDARRMANLMLFIGLCLLTIAVIVWLRAE